MVVLPLPHRLVVMALLVQVVTEIGIQSLAISLLVHIVMGMTCALDALVRGFLDSPSELIWLPPSIRSVLSLPRVMMGRPSRFVHDATLTIRKRWQELQPQIRRVCTWVVAVRFYLVGLLLSPLVRAFPPLRLIDGRPNLRKNGVACLLVMGLMLPPLP